MSGRFNPRAREGRDRLCRAGCGHSSGVSIHAPGKGATLSNGDLSKALGVSIHAPGKGATPAPQAERGNRHVSIHAPGKGATAAEAGARCVNAFQSTRPGRARVFLTPDSRYVRECVSIHAPGKGATTGGQDAILTDCCFNPRAREGRDFRKVASGMAMHKFQSTRPGRARHGQSERPLNMLSVSIHAPGKGATQVRGDDPLFALVSIHAPGKGATILTRLRNAKWEVSIHAPGKGARQGWQKCPGCPEFQSTRPGRARGVQRQSCRHFCCFNPRAREGRDAEGADALLLVVVSIHAPGKGATPNLAIANGFYPVSIHAPGKGATKYRHA